MKFLKNRFLIGLFCIALGLAVSLVAIPKLVRETIPDQITAVRLKSDLKAGEKVSTDMIELISASKNTLPNDAFSSVEDAAGQYTASMLYAGDFLSPAKLISSSDHQDYLKAATDKGMRLVSITLPSLSAGVSGKIRSGDVISIMALMKSADKVQTLDPNPQSQNMSDPPSDLDQEGETASDLADNRPPIANTYRTETMIHPQLRFVEVYSLSAADGTDARVESQPSDDNKNQLPVTLTVFATEQQAMLLAELEHKATIHISRVAGLENAADFIDPDKLIISGEDS
jgi:pilus assembly protein CpaB